jgi:hypothetical protein
MRRTVEQEQVHFLAVAETWVTSGTQISCTCTRFVQTHKPTFIAGQGATEQLITTAHGDRWSAMH